MYIHDITKIADYDLHIIYKHCKDLTHFIILDNITRLETASSHVHLSALVTVIT